MSTKLLATLPIVLAVVIWSSPAAAISISEEPSEDSALQNNTITIPGSTGASLGQQERLTVGWGSNTVGDYSFIIMKWSLASVPAGNRATTDGTLTLTLLNGVGSSIASVNATEGGIMDGQTIDAYLIKGANIAWIDTKASANNLDQTAVPTVPWVGGATLGGFDEDLGYGATPISSYTWGTGGPFGPGTTGTNGPLDVFTMTIPKDVINGWLDDPSNNAGILLRPQLEVPTNGRLRIRSTRHATIHSGGGPGPMLAFTAEPTTQPHAGDFDGDGDVDGADFVAWQTHFPTASGASLADGDADGDGDVDGADFVVWQTNFPFTPGPGVSPIPEPASVILLLIGAGIALKLRCLRCDH